LLQIQDAFDEGLLPKLSVNICIVYFRP